MLRKIYTKTLSMILLSVVFVFSDCDSENEKKYKVGFSQCAFDTFWRLQMNHSIAANATQKRDMEIIITDGQNSNSKQIEDIKNLVAQKIDLLMVSPNEAEALTDIVSKVYHSGIPVIVVDRKVVGEDFTCFIGADNVEIGSKAAGYLNLLGNGHRDILELHGQRGASAALERSKGFHAVLDTTKGFRMIGDLYCEWSYSKAYSNVKKYWQDGGRFDVIYSHNDDMATGAWDALHDLGVNTDSIMIIGTDGAAGDHGGIKAVADGKIDVTFLYPDGNVEAIEAAYKILHGKGNEVKKFIGLHTVQIDENNAPGLFDQMKFNYEQEDRLIKQDGLLKEKDEKISDQMVLLYSISTVGVMFCIFSLIIMKLYHTNKAQNVQLNEKNAEINAQKEELESQAVFLSQMNEELRISKENTLGSIRYAMTIQNAALPSENDLNKFFNAFILYHPKDIVSGDFYWNACVEQDGHKMFFFAVVDCTGHGVPGAFMSLIGVNLLDQIVKQRRLVSPAEILEELNKSVRESLRQDETENNDGMEAAFCRIDEISPDTYTLTYEGAKFPVFHYVKAENKIYIYKTSRREIGGKFRNIESALDFHDTSVPLSEGDRIYMTSDGLGDQNNFARKRYGRQRFVNVLESTVNLSIKAQGGYIWESLQEFMGDCTQRDDITVMGVEISPKSA